MRACAIIPAFEAEATVGEVVRSLTRVGREARAIFVVDDGSQDRTAVVARSAGASVVRHASNRGKGAALRTGMVAAHEAGFDVAVTVDADGQHPAEEAIALLAHPADHATLVLGIRDLVRAGAPRQNQISNNISNFFLSLFSGRRLADTQCGLRRYPIAPTLALGASADGYAFESEVILRAVAARLPIVEVPVRVVYPPPGERITHFDSVRDPARIVARVVFTLAATRVRPRFAPPMRAPAARAEAPRDEQPLASPP